MSGMQFGAKMLESKLMVKIASAEKQLTGAEDRMSPKEFASFAWSEPMGAFVTCSGAPIYSFGNKCCQQINAGLTASFLAIPLLKLMAASQGDTLYLVDARITQCIRNGAEGRRPHAD